MKKSLFLIMLMLGIVFLIPAQTGGPIDLVLVLDTSASMSASYKATGDYLTGPFLREFLRIGDTFHLISFSSAPKLEISRRVEGVGDVETIIGRILLMYPLDPGSDLSGALSFAEHYASSIPTARRKKIVLVSDGSENSAAALISEASSRFIVRGMELQYIKVPITGTPPSSGRPPAARPSQEQRPTAPPPASGAAGSPGAAPSQGTIPSTGAPSSGAAAPPAAAPSQGAAVPPGAAPAAGTAQGTPPAPPAGSRPPEVPAGGTADQTPPPASQETGSPGREEIPESIPPETAGDPPVREEPAGSGEDIPQQTAQQTPQEEISRQAEETRQPARPASSGRETGISDGLPLPLIIGLGIAALLVLALIIFLVTRNLHSSPNRVMAKAAVVPPADDRKRIEEERENQRRGAEMMSSFAANQKKSQPPPLSYPPPKPKPMPKDKPDDNPSFDNGPPMLSLFVADQNTAIGRRNIHAVKSGYTFSVGGGKSDFLIFLVPMPPHIADVHFDGRQCTFIPRRPEYFPDIGSQQVSNCIGKTIRVISDKHYELHIRIERYEDPLKALNKLLLSISVPGEVER